MTVATETRLERLARRGPSTATRRTLTSDLSEAFASVLAESKTLRWPSERYAQNPVGFCENILGFEPWARQIEIIEALRDYSRVSVASAQKCGKTRIASAAALWFFETVPRGRVIVTSGVAPQIEKILWSEISLLYHEAGRCIDCKRRDPYEREIPRPCPHSALLDGKLAARSTTGLGGTGDGRTIFGITSKTAELVAGYSGPQLWIVDEASAFKTDDVFDVIDGNGLGGGLKVLYLGNPTTNRGRFFESHNDEKQKKHYYQVQMSALEASQARDRQGNPFGHLAREGLIEELKEKWGEDNPLYKWRILGQFVVGQEGAPFSIEKIDASQKLWFDLDDAQLQKEHRLYLGVDPAGESGVGDESAFAVRRGPKVVSLFADKGLTADDHLAKILELIAAHRYHREVPVVVYDAGGVGAELKAKIIEYLAQPHTRPPFVHVPVRSNHKTEDSDRIFPMVRDALIANLERWFRTGAIPTDEMLAKELNTVRWEAHADNQMKALSKDEMRKILGRSPDRMDAVALSVWEPVSVRVKDPANLSPSAQDLVERDRQRLAAAQAPAGGWDAYGSRGEAGRGPRVDPIRALRERDSGQQRPRPPWRR